MKDLTRSSRHAAWVAFVALLLLCGAGCPSPPVQQPPQQPHHVTLLMEPLPYKISNGFDRVFANFALMNPGENPLEVVAKRSSPPEPAIQRLPTAQDYLSILVVDEKLAHEGDVPTLVPSTCGVLTAVPNRTIDLCDEAGQCEAVPADHAPIILCNRQALYMYFVYSRMQVDTPTRENTIVSFALGDWATYDLLHGIERVSEGLTKEQRGELSRPYPTDEWRTTMILAFLIAHEVAHISGHDTMEHEPEGAVVRGSPPGQGSATACQNFVEMHKRWLGFAWRPEHASEPEPEGEDSATRAKVRAIWDSELAADAYAARILERMVPLAYAWDQVDFFQARLHALEALTAISTISWYRRQGQLAEIFCSEFAASNSYMNRCACDPAVAPQLGQLLDRTHPPIPFRMMVASEQFGTYKDPKRWPDDLYREAFFQQKLLSVATEMAFRIAYNTCVLPESNKPYPDLHAIAVAPYGDAIEPNDEGRAVVAACKGGGAAAVRPPCAGPSDCKADEACLWFPSGADAGVRCVPRVEAQSGNAAVVCVTNADCSDGGACKPALGSVSFCELQRPVEYE